MIKYKLCDICTIEKGKTGIKNSIPGEYPLVVTAEERLTNNSYQFDCNAVCIPLVSSTGHGHASIKRIHYQSGKFALGSILCAVIPIDEKKVLAEYLYVYLSVYKDTLIVPLMKGAANVSLNMKDLKNVEVFVPSIEEQYKIIYKYKNIMKNIDNIFSENNKIIKYINKIKEQILTNAFQGRLVKNSNDIESVDKLLEEIKNIKEKKIINGELYQEKELQQITDSEKLFEIPKSWRWVRLGNYCEKVTDQVASGSFASLRENVPSLKTKDYAIMVKTADFANNFTKDLTYTTEHGYNFLNNSNLFGGELILSNIGSIGKVFIVPNLNEKMTLAPNSVMLRFTDDSLRDYIYYYLLSPIGFSQLMSITSGTTMKKFNKTDLKRIVIPIPPKEEQDRIVEKLLTIEKYINEVIKNTEDTNLEVNEILKSFLNTIV